MFKGEREMNQSRHDDLDEIVLGVMVWFGVLVVVGVVLWVVFEALKQGGVGSVAVAFFGFMFLFTLMGLIYLSYREANKGGL